MYSLNKLIGLITDPAVIGLAGLVLGFVLSFLRVRRLAIWLFCLATLWLWFWMSPATYRWLASGLERDYPVVKAEDVPVTDAIMVLGGGMAENTNRTVYSEMWMSADRAWHGARLYNAGKATNVYVTCTADVALLTDLGVPKSALRYNTEARNTEEEAKAMAKKGVKRIALVTSAWHMRRALLMFEKYAPHIEVFPAATDHEALMRCGWKTGFGWRDLIPDAQLFFLSSYMFHEQVGYWGYKLFR